MPPAVPAVVGYWDLCEAIDLLDSIDAAPQLSSNFASLAVFEFYVTI